DIALLERGGWVVVELNDGGISGLPEQLDPHELYRALVGRSGRGY
ncbi:MAG: ATP-grasp domain-containing protein, partial [Myxococcales bacterium]|nr:ATP-grasp domain-containing protein [Myxococcales bacterium]